MKSLCTRCSYTSIKNCRQWGDPALTESWLCHQSLTIDHRYVSARFDRIISSTIWESGWPFVFTHRSSSSRASSCCSLLSRERLDFHCSRLWQTRVEDTEDERNMIRSEQWSCNCCMNECMIALLVYSAVVCSIPAWTPSHSACLCLYTVCVREGDSPVNAGPTTPW